MKIESIRIQGYRSLADLTFEPQAFTVLVGPNNAGKSNIVDALAFLSDVYAHGVKHAIDSRGGFENIAFREDGVPRKELAFETLMSASAEEVLRTTSGYPQWDMPEPHWQRSNAPFQVMHRFRLRGRGDPLVSEFIVEDEEIRLDLSTDISTPVLRAGRRETQVDVAVNPDPYLIARTMPLFGDETQAESFMRRAATMETRPWDFIAITLLGASPPLAAFFEHLADMRTYQLLPNTCRLPSPPTSAADLGHHGDNLTAVVQNLKDRSPIAWASVLEDMTSVMPDLEEIEILQTTDKLWTLVFTEANIGRRWTADEVSDGTIRALALFSAIHAPRTTLLAIEEPENSLHPWVLRELATACRTMSTPASSKQFLLTTYSPVLIDHLYPTEIAIVWKERGQTMICPLLEMEPEVEESWADGRIKLSGLLDSGLLRQTVPVPLG